VRGGTELLGVRKLCLAHHHLMDCGANLSDVGELLRAARQKRNVSVSEAATATRIKPAFIEALEDGDYAILPGPAYVTGFLRNYAQYLRLNVDDILQDYYTYSPAPMSMVKPATRVLAGVHTRQTRKRFVWFLAAICILCAGAFAIKVYNDQYDHGYAAPLKITPQNVGANLNVSPSVHHSRTHSVALRLRAVSPVWVRVTADGHRVFQGLLHRPGHLWHAVHTVYVMTYDGSRLRAAENGKSLGSVSSRPGLGVWAATSGGWHRIS
jgi:transcriptional regulator with XRE-family HTH domain